ncbi:MAG: hypothetical protein CMH55_00035 [Myxococcales bacterium]|nr:hypothetical protein [Myxococcales bacterium]
MASKNDPTKTLQPELEGLRQEWDRFIQGLEKRPPIPRQEKFAKKMRQAMATRQMGHVERFKLNQLQQRFMTLRNRWERVLRQIEDGTFRRERTNRPSAAPAPMVMPGSQPPTQSTTNNPDNAAFERFKSINDRGGAQTPSREAFLRSLESKRAAMREKYGFNVKFEVEDKGGKPSLKVVKSED